jgi:hypothetical protein
MQKYFYKKSQKEVRKQQESTFLLLFLLDNKRIWNLDTSQGSGSVASVWFWASWIQIR